MDDDADEAADAARDHYPPVLRRTVRETFGTVNPSIIPYWASVAEEDEETVRLLRTAFMGERRIVTSGVSPKFAYVPTGLAAIQADPGAYVAVADSHGVTAIHGAALNGFLEVVKVLVENGADPFERSADGCDAMAIAKARKHERVVTYLEHVGPAMRAVREARELEEADRLARGEAKDRADAERRAAIEEKLRQEAEFRAFKQRQKADALAKAQEEARLREERAQGVDPFVRGEWKTIEIDCDTQRNLGYFPRRPE